MPKRIAIPAALLLASLLATSGCDSALGGSKNPLPTPTPVIAGVPSPAQNIPPEIPTVYVPPVGTVYSIVPPVPSVAYPVPPTPTEYVSNAEGDTPEAQAVIDKWNVAYRNLSTISARQELLLVNVDGSMASQPVLELGGALGTEETWILPHPVSDLTGVRSRIKVYTKDGFLLNVFGNSGNSTMGSLYPNELHRAMPESTQNTSIPFYYVTLTSSFFLTLKPTDYTTYTLVGNKVVDGHSLIELKGKRTDGGDNTEAYLDESNYLPYRIIHEPRQGNPGWQSTLTDVKINEPVLESDLEVGLPKGDYAVMIFEPTEKSGDLPTYSSLRDPNLIAGFHLFEPPSGSGNVITPGLIVKDGGKTPILFFNADTNGTKVMEGVYLPYVVTRGEWTVVQEAGGDPIDVGGLPGTIRTESGTYSDGSGTVKIRFQRDGTWIEVSAHTKDEALKVAESLQPVTPIDGPTK